MIYNPVMNRDGLVSTSGTSDLTRLLQEQQSQAAGLVPRNMDLFTQRFDQTAPVGMNTDTTSANALVNNSGLAAIKNASKEFIKNKLMNKFSKNITLPFTPPSMAVLGAMVPKEDPVVTQTRDYYSGLYGLDDIGRIQQGELMAGYSPISGGGLYTLTGGKFGEPPTLGLDKAYQKRIDTIREKGLPRLIAAGKDTTNLQNRLNELLAAQEQENKIMQQIKLANATSQQKKTIQDFKDKKINADLPEQPPAGGGNGGSTATAPAKTSQGVTTAQHQAFRN